jgi:hypothetical protein
LCVNGGDGLDCQPGIPGMLTGISFPKRADVNSS